MLSNKLISLTVKNFRSLANVSIDTERLTILFGPNGAGKSAFLEALWFVLDCSNRGVDIASSDRGHGIGLLWEGADEGEDLGFQAAEGVGLSVLVMMLMGVGRSGMVGWERSGMEMMAKMSGV